MKGIENFKITFSHGVIEREPGEYWVIGAGESLQSEICTLGTFLIKMFEVINLGTFKKATAKWLVP